jgi:hypothetical protein
MSLQDRIEQLRKDREHMEDVIKEARKELWESAYVARNDARREGESDEHWHHRRRRNRERYERRDDVVEHLANKKHAIQKEIDDLVEHRKEYKEEQRDKKDSDYEKGSSKIVIMDGKPIVEDLAYWLSKARQNGWHGVLVSGYRTPEYSESLCRAMCGQPTCPGRCAGRNSNHARTEYGGPAADVSDYYTCETVLDRIGAPYWNNLPIDPVHMSRSGA